MSGVPGKAARWLRYVNPARRNRRFITNSGFVFLPRISAITAERFFFEKTSAIGVSWRRLPYC